MDYSWGSASSKRLRTTGLERTLVRKGGGGGRGGSEGIRWEVRGEGKRRDRGLGKAGERGAGGQRMDRRNGRNEARSGRKLR